MIIYNSDKLYPVHFITSIANSLVFLVSFVVISYLSTLIEVKISSNDEKFQSKFEKYFVLAAGLYLSIIFCLSTFQILCLITRKNELLKIWGISFTVTAGIFVCTVLACGIYIAVAGTGYIGYTAIAVSIIVGVLAAHSILLGKYTYEMFKQQEINDKRKSISTESASSEIARSEDASLESERSESAQSTPYGSRKHSLNAVDSLN